MSGSSRFFCAGCDDVRHEQGEIIRPLGAPWWVRVVLCHACSERRAMDDAFRSHVHQNSNRLAFVSYTLQMADALGVPWERFREALISCKFQLNDVDRILKLPAGSANHALWEAVTGIAARPQMKTPEPTEVNSSALDLPKLTHSSRDEESPALYIVGRFH